MLRPFRPHLLRLRPSSLRLAATAAALALTLLGTAGIARAQDSPALRAASGDDKAKLAALIEGARKEGAVSYWDTIIQPETSDALAAGFRKHYGLPASFKVNYTLSVTTALITRVDQEINAGQVTIDVAAVASPTWVFELIAAGHLLQHASPEYKFYQSAFDGGLGQDGYFAFNGAYMFVPMWSEDHVKFTGKSYKDAVTAVAPGRLSVGDATKSATYLATFHGQRQALGDDLFREIAKRKPPFPLRSELIAARLISGEDLMTWSGMPTRAYQYNQKGGRLKFLLPEEGVVMMPQSMFALAKAPHPNAAKLWIDFILSEEGQSILVKGEALMSGRSGFKSPLPEYAPPIESLKLIKMDWKGLSTDQLKRVRSEWTAIFNP